MKLGVRLRSTHEGDLVAIDVDPTGSVVSAGGEVGDVWLSIDDQPAAQVHAEWQSGARPRRAGVPLKVEVRRNGQSTIIRPMWRSEQRVAAVSRSDGARNRAPTVPLQVEVNPSPPPVRGVASVPVEAERQPELAAAGEVSVAETSEPTTPYAIQNLARLSTRRPPLASELADMLRSEREPRRHSSVHRYNAFPLAGDAPGYEPFRLDADPYDPFHDLHDL
jgi:hypothetical protein